MGKKAVRVLIVDDSAVVRELLTQGLSQDLGIEVVGTASDPYEARDKIVWLQPQVITLDIEMPKMDGIEFLKKLMPQYPVPVIMVSSQSEKGKEVILDALEAGAVDYVAKPSAIHNFNFDEMLSELRTKIKIASMANVSHWKKQRIMPPFGVDNNKTTLTDSKGKLIVIGASTGGTEAIKRVITQFPPTTPAVLIVQHMPPIFTKLFAEKMNTLCQMDVQEARSGDQVMNGRVLIAPGGKQMTIVRSGGSFQVVCKRGDLVSGHQPSVNVLMHSVAKYVGSNAIGVMLTGMGEDGSDGMLAMRKTGAQNIAQDEASSVVFGMPAKAYEKGGADRLIPLNQIATEVLKIVSNKNV